MSDTITAFDILEKWAQFTHFDPNRIKFNLLSSEYRYHSAGKIIQALSNGYDPGGEISAIYAKSVFTKILRDQKISLYDLFSAPENLKDVSEMWDVFQSAEMADIEQHFLIGIEKLIQQVSGRKMLTGTTADEPKEQSLLPSLLTAAASVAEELGQCKAVLFARGGVFMPTTRFNTHIHFFDRFADCLLAIEAAADSIYLCYITCHGTSDGYFTFLLKSNGNVLSINERVDETFIGQHAHSRNARWTEDKKTRLFPYQFIIGGENFDYKGYARKQIIDEGQLDFFKLGADAYMPIVLAMVMLTNRYTTTDLDTIPQKYVDSMLPTNLNQKALTETALVKVEKSGIAAIHREISFGFTLEDVLSGAAGAKFDHAIGNDGLANGIAKDHRLDAYCVACSTITDTTVSLPTESFTLHRFRRHDRAVISRQEERKYYLGKQLVARNRHKRMEQKSPSLEEFRIAQSTEVGKLSVVKGTAKCKDPRRILPGAIYMVDGMRMVLQGRHGKTKNGQPNYLEFFGHGNFTPKHCEFVRKGQGWQFV